MNTNHMSDEELDRLFRESAENVQPPFEEEAWQAMEQKLDKVQGHSTWLRRLLPLLLLGLFALLLVLNLPRGEKRPSKEHKATAGEESTSSTALPTPAATLTDATAPEATLGNAEPSGKAPDAAQQQLAHPTAPAGNTTKAVTTAKSASAAESIVAQLQKRRVVLVPPTRHEQPRYESKLTLLESIVGTSEEAVPLQIKVASVPIPLDSADAVAVQAPADSSDRKTTADRKGIQLTVVLAPDLTSVKFKAPDAVSTNAGLLVGVPLSPRLSLVTGAVWASKRYDAAPEDYQPSTGFWDGKTKPDYIDANCKVLDIPLNLAYRLWEKNSNALAVQAGLSSYIMLNERYRYSYSGYGGGYDTVWEVKNQNRHWFKVLNLSFSYARQLNPALAVGASPFVKVPLDGIGAGNVRLTSAGLFLTATYTLHTP